MLEEHSCLEKELSTIFWVGVLLASLSLSSIVLPDVLSTQSARGVDFVLDLDVTHTITPVPGQANLTTLIFNGGMRVGNHGGIGQPAVEDANPQKQQFNLSVTYKVGGAVDPLVAVVGLKRNSSLETQYPVSYYVVLSPGQTNATTVTWYEDGVSQYVQTDYALDGTIHHGTRYDVGIEAYPITGTESTPGDNYQKWAACPPAWNASILIADINGDGIVDIYDAILLAKAFYTWEGDPRYNPAADLNKDGVIDIYDAIILANNWGKHVP